MQTREVTLQTGIIVGTSGRAMSATIREGTLDDELVVLESGFSGLLLYRKTMIRRVRKIGALENPEENIIRKLTDTDWELLENAMTKLDKELALAAGLIKPDGFEDPEPDPAGRDEPGEAAGSDV